MWCKKRRKSAQQEEQSNAASADHNSINSNEDFEIIVSTPKRSSVKKLIRNCDLTATKVIISIESASDSEPSAVRKRKPLANLASDIICLDVDDQWCSSASAPTPFVSKAAESFSSPSSVKRRRSRKKSMEKDIRN